MCLLVSFGSTYLCVVVLGVSIWDSVLASCIDIVWVVLCVVLPCKRRQSHVRVVATSIMVWVVLLECKCMWILKGIWI